MKSSFVSQRLRPEAYASFDLAIFRKLDWIVVVSERGGACKFEMKMKMKVPTSVCEKVIPGRQH